MLKLNASYSKKIPAEQDYSSKSYHAAVEVELSDSLSPEELKRRIHDTFALVKESVEEEINIRATLPVSSKEEAASPRQIGYLVDLAKRTGADMSNCLRRYSAADARDLSRQQCSSLIDELQKQGKAA